MELELWFEIQENFGLDVTKKFSNKIWVGSTKNGYVQSVILDDLPHFCVHCKSLGHAEVECRILHPNLTCVMPVGTPSEDLADVVEFEAVNFVPSSVVEPASVVAFNDVIEHVEPSLGLPVVVDSVEVHELDLVGVESSLLPVFSCGSIPIDPSVFSEEAVSGLLNSSALVGVEDDSAVVQNGVIPSSPPKLALKTLEGVSVLAGESNTLVPSTACLSERACIHFDVINPVILSRSLSAPPSLPSLVDETGLHQDVVDTFCFNNMGGLDSVEVPFVEVPVTLVSDQELAELVGSKNGEEVILQMDWLTDSAVLSPNTGDGVDPIIVEDCSLSVHHHVGFIIPRGRGKRGRGRGRK